MIRIRYSLSLPASVVPEEAERLLKELRQFCLDQPFKNVNDFIRTETKLGFTARIGLADSRPFEVYLCKYPEQWTFESCCWTGYKLAEAEFLHRYLSVIRALDRAKEMGFKVEVKDGGGYWRNRNLKRLLGIKKVIDSLPDPQVLFEATSDNMSIGNFKPKLEEIN